MATTKLRPEKITHSSVDTILITHDILKAWKDPPFQRPLRVNAKVIALAEEMKQTGGVFPGILTIGLLNDAMFLLDGQHRREAWKISGLAEGFSDVRYRRFASIAEMGTEFVKLNSQIVRLRPDDILRGLEGNSEALQLIRKRCPFIGYDMIRRTAKSPILGMSLCLRSWYGSNAETPISSAPPAIEIATSLTLESATLCAGYMTLCERAWGRAPEYASLWKSLNLTLCAWLYRALVLTPAQNHTQLAPEQFKNALVQLSTEGDYIDWLYGRVMNDRDRGPGYERVKAAFAARIRHDTGKRALLPAPMWATHDARSRGGVR